MINPDEILGKTMGSSLIGHTAGPDEDQLMDPTYEQYETPLPNGVGSIDSIVKQLKTYQPKLYSKFVPKVYEQTSLFHDWRIPGITSSVTYLALKSDKTLQGWQAYVNFGGWALEWESYNNPTFFVTKDFLDAMLHTDIPDTFDLSDFELPFPAMAFMLPKDSPLRFNGKPVPWLGVGRFTGPVKTELGEVRTQRKDLDKLVLTTSFLPNSFFAPGIQYSGLNETVRLKAQDFRDQSHSEHSQVKAAVGDAEFCLQMLRLVVNLVLAMDSVPELVTKGVYMRRSSQSRGSEQHTPSVWSPNIIGLKYRTVREESEGTHASPRSHWRRGHWRRTRIGSINCSTMNCKHPPSAHLKEGLCQLDNCNCTRYTPSWTYRKDWIKPVLVNALAY